MNSTHNVPLYRYELINSVLPMFGPNPKYLEIGVFDPAGCFDLIQTENKDSVDPGVEWEVNPVKYKLTSDEFFLRLDNGTLDKPHNYLWDVIFIDGLHLAPQVEKDIHNALRHLNPKGFIFLHDCNPPDIHMAREDYYVNGEQQLWNGTTWKAFFKARATNPYIDTCVVNTDWGVGVIRFGANNSEVNIEDNPFFEYNVMAENRTRHLGLISPMHWYNWLNSRNA